MQGSRQGAYPSPHDYLSCLCKLLFTSPSAPAGYSIGSIKVTTPTCTDDMIITSSALQLQALILLAPYMYMPMRKDISSTLKKTVIVPFNISSEDHLNFLTTQMVWSTNGVNIPVEKEMIPIGICRSTTCPNATVEDRTSTVCKTMYVLMGSGLHGLTRLPVRTYIHIYN